MHRGWAAVVSIISYFRRLPHLKHIIITGEDANAAGTFNFSDVVKMGTSSDLLAVDDICKNLDPQDAVNIQFTSVRYTILKS